MILEYNGNFGVKGFHRESLVALTKLAAAKGYKLLACDETGTNAFYPRDDLRPEIEPVLRRRPSDRCVTIRFAKPCFGARNLEAVAQERGQKLVEV